MSTPCISEGVAAAQRLLSPVLRKNSLRETWSPGVCIQNPRLILTKDRAMVHCACIRYAVGVTCQTKPTQIVKEKNGLSATTGAQSGSFLPMGYAGRLSVVYGAPMPDREHRHRVSGRELATQLRASYIDDEGRRAGHWKSPSQSVKAWSPLVVDSACPYRGNRESGRRDSSSRNRE